MRRGYTFSIFSFCVILSIVFLSCEKQSVTEDFDEDKFGYDYFPLEVGKYWIYEVDSIIYDDEGATVIETRSQIREEIVEVFEDASGDDIFRIERYWRSGDSVQWEVTDVWAAHKNSSQAFRIEENLKFVKFVFPPLDGTRWDSNLFLDNSTVITVAGESISMFAGWDDSRIESVDQVENIGIQEYEKVATILLTDDEEANTIERRYALEKYARGVGLIYKEYEILDSQCSSCTGTWREKAEKGFILKQTLLEYN